VKPGELRARLKGRLVTGDDADYDSLRMVLADVDRHPAAIALVADNDDVVAAIAYARANRLELAVRSGGHSGAGHGSVDGGLVIDLREMRGIEIDTTARTARAQAGATAAAVVSAAGEHGLVAGFGDTGSVGIGGITLGGGIGFLSRRYGMTIDNLFGAEIVTADGAVRRVDAEREPELFWAIRGGGGNFGVATSFTYRLHELPQIVGGMMVLPATRESVARFVALSQAAPEALTTIANVMNCPPMPFVAEEHHGKPVIMGLLCYAGPAGDAEPVLAPFRAIASPLADMLAPMPYAQMFAPEDPDYRPTAESTTMFKHSFDQAAAATLLERIAASDSPMCGAQIRVHGGAIARVPAGATAFAYRAAPMMVNLFCFYTGADDRPRRAEWIRDLKAALDDGEPGAYVNFLTDEGLAPVLAAYPQATLERLRAIKARYDPDNLFHVNQNIPPQP
jgi:FAD/FMN-containing dehydrogenase